MIQNIGQVAITVNDTGQAIEFYRDKLGLKMLFQAGNMAFFDCAGVRLMMSPGEKATESYSSIVYFRTADIQKAYEHLKGLNVPFDREPHLIARMPDHDLWMSFFRDPSNNVMALMSEVRG